jgi:hypothetical protein
VCLWNQGGGGPKTFGNHCSTPTGRRSEVKSLRKIAAARCSEKLVSNYKIIRCYGEEDRGMNFICFLHNNWHTRVKKIFEHLQLIVCKHCTACVSTFHSIFNDGALCKVTDIKPNQLVSFPSLFTLCCLLLLPPHDVNNHALGFTALHYYMLSLTNGSLHEFVL